MINTRKPRMNKKKVPRKNAGRTRNVQRPENRLQGFSTKSSGGSNDYGQQLSQILRKGYGATLRSYPSTAAFAKVYLDPLSLRSARLPDFPVFPSTLVRIEQEFTLTAPTTGNYGWALFNPLNMITQNVSYASYTNGTGIPPPTFQAAGTGVSNAFAPSQYLNSDFDNTSQNAKAVRIVAWGMTCTNVSSELSLAGKYYANQSAPRLTDSLINTDETTMQSFPTYKTLPAGNRKSFYYHRMITEKSDLRYNQYDIATGTWVYSDDNSLSSESTAYIGMFLRAGAFVGPESIVVRVAGHYEIIGQTRNVPGLGVTKSDTSGVEKVVSYGHAKRMESATAVDHISNMPDQKKDSFVKGLLEDVVDLSPIAPNTLHNVVDAIPI